MRAVDFARAAKGERDALVATYGEANGGSSVAELLAVASLTDAQRRTVLSALGQAVTDAFYTMLLALDGSGALGGIQQTYRLIAEDGSIIANGGGALEAAAFEVFQVA